MTRKFTVTLPDGTVATRSSKSKDYGFAIVAGPQTVEGLTAALEREAVEADAIADSIQAALDAGSIKIRNRGFQTGDLDYRGEHSYNGCEVFLAGARDYVYSWSDSKGLVKKPGADEPVGARAYLTARAEGAIARYRGTADECRATAEEYRTGARQARTDYSVVRWSTRRDLAVKALGEFAYLTERQGRPLTVVAVD